MDYELLTQELLEYYANLLIVQYNGKSKASQTIKLLADMLIAGCLIFQIRDAFDYRTAVVQDAYNFTVVGNPTITADGIASGLNSNNNMQLNNSIQIGASSNFKIEFQFTVGNTWVENWIFAAATANNFCLWIGKNNLDVYMNNVHIGNLNNGFAQNGSYKGYLKREGRIYTIYCENLKTHTSTTQTATMTEDYSFSGALWIGKSGSSRDWSTDLKQFSITVDGVEVYKAWQPPAINYRAAVGTQLDIIGKWVGVSRFYNASKYWNATFLSYPNSNDLVPTDKTDTLQHGYSDYANFDTDEGNILTYDALSSVKQSLSDDNYRIVIGLKIIKNNINHIRGEIDKAIWNYFNHRVYTTWDTHKITYNYPPELADIINICAYKKVLPVPIGCSISYYQYS